MGLKDDKKKSKSRKKHESSSSSSSPSSSSMSDSSSSSSSSSTSSSSCSAESSPEIAKRMTPPPRNPDRCEIDVLRSHTPEIRETKTYDDFDVPSRDYDPNSRKRLESAVSKVKQNPKESERMAKDFELNKKSYDKRDREILDKKQVSEPLNNAEDSKQEDSSRQNKTESRRSRDEKRGSGRRHGSRESKKNDDRKGRDRSTRENEKESNKSPDSQSRQVSRSMEKEHGEKRDEREDINWRSKRKLDQRRDVNDESDGRTEQSKRRKNSSDEKKDVVAAKNNDGLGKLERHQGHMDDDAKKNDGDKRNEVRKDTERRMDRNAERNDNSRRNRGWSGKDSGEYDYRQRSPRNNSDWRRNRRSDDRYSSRRDYNDGNQRMIRRYWDNEPRDFESRGKRDDDSEDEHVVGERFYGDDNRKRDRRARENSPSKNEKKNPTDELPADPEKIPQSQKRTVDLLTSKTGGAYIPPAKLRMMQADITDKSGAAYQRIAWEALKKSIHGHINKVNTSNIGLITRELLRENVVRGRGLLARSIIQAQAASPTFTPVYAALTAVVNSKFPNIGELLLKRLVIQFRRGFRRSNKKLCISSGTFIAHLVNQRVAHEILALEFLTLLVETPTDDSIEVAISFLKECGMKLTEMSKKGIEAIFEMLRNILHEGQLDKRVQYMIEVMFQIRKDGFKDHPAVSEELDLVEEAQQYTHLITLDENMDSQDILNVFKFDPDYIANEEKYKQLSKEILDTDNSGSESEGDDADGDSSDEESSEDEAEAKEGGVIVDNTETNLTALRRTIYLTIHSSLDFEECAHKLMKMQLKPGQEIELCHMFLDCCAEMRTYEKFFGLLAGRFCAINKIYVTPFEQIFRDSYDTIHRLDTNKLRNVSKFFAHLLFTDSISWEVLSCIKLNEEDTTSSSRIFIKILFQELSEYMGLSKLNQRVKDVTLQEAFDGLFPRDDPKNTRFAINFFTSIGLGGLTDDLREHLKSRPKPAVVSPVIKEPVKESSSSSSSSESSSSSSSSDSSDSSSSSSSSSPSSSSSDGDRKRKKKKKKSAKSSTKLKSATRKSRPEKISSNEPSHGKDRRDRKESNDSRSKSSKKSERRR